MAVRSHGRGRDMSSARAASMLKAEQAPWSCRAQRVGAYEVGGGWELQDEGAHYDGEPLPS